MELTTSPPSRGSPLDVFFPPGDGRARAWSGRHPQWLPSNQELEPWPPGFEWRWASEEVRGVATAFAHSMVWDVSSQHLGESMRHLGAAFRVALERRRKGAPRALEALKQRMRQARRGPGESCQP